MSIKKLNKKTVLDFLLNNIQLKGKHNIAKNLVLNSSIKISRNVYNLNFDKIFENCIKNYILPFEFYKGSFRQGYRYVKNLKSISFFITKLKKSIKENKKRFSFKFYFENEINKLLDNSNSLNCLKYNCIESFVSFNSNTFKENVNLYEDINIKSIISKRNFVKQINKFYYNYYHFNQYRYENENIFINESFKKSIKRVDINNIMKFIKID